MEERKKISKKNQARKKDNNHNLNEMFKNRKLYHNAEDWKTNDNDY